MVFRGTNRKVFVSVVHKFLGENGIDFVMIVPLWFWSVFLYLIFFLPDEIDDHPVSPFEPIKSPIEVFKLDITEVNVFFEVQNLDAHVPILCLRTSLDTEIRDWSKEVSALGVVVQSTSTVL